MCSVCTSTVLLAAGAIMNKPYCMSVASAGSTINLIFSPSVVLFHIYHAGPHIETNIRLSRTVTSGLTPAALFPDAHWASVR
jgi:hypothetical protein